MEPIGTSRRMRLLRQVVSLILLVLVIVTVLFPTHLLILLTVLAVVASTVLRVRTFRDRTFGPPGGDSRESDPK